MPNSYIHTIYKQFIQTALDKEKAGEAAEADALEDMIDDMT